VDLNYPPLGSEGGHGEVAQARGIGQHVDLNDFAVRDRESHDRDRSSTIKDDRASGSVDERRTHDAAESRAEPCPPGHGARPANYDRPACSGPSVGPKHDIGVQYDEERVKVTISGGGKERVDDLPLTPHIEVGKWRPALNAAAGAWAAGPPSPEQATVIGSYRLF
jgi:hypothetical protein